MTRGAARAIEEIQAVIEALVGAWNRHDLDAYARLFAEDADFVNAAGLWWKGRAEIRRAHEATHETIFRNTDLEVLELGVRLVKPDVAVVRVSWVLIGLVAPSGEALPGRRGLLVATFVHGAGRWSIVDAQNTDIVDAVLAPPPSKPQ